MPIIMALCESSFHFNLTPPFSPIHLLQSQLQAHRVTAAPFVLRQISFYMRAMRESFLQNVWVIIQQKYKPLQSLESKKNEKSYHVTKLAKLNTV